MNPVTILMAAFRGLGLASRVIGKDRRLQDVRAPQPRLASVVFAKRRHLPLVAPILDMLDTDARAAVVSLTVKAGSSRQTVSLIHFFYDSSASYTREMYPCIPHSEIQFIRDAATATSAAKRSGSRNNVKLALLWFLRCKGLCAVMPGVPAVTSCTRAG